MIKKSILTISFLLLFGTLGFVSFLLNQPPILVHAAFPGWSNVTTIYYDPSQEDSNNNFLEQAATELKTHLEQVSSNTFTIETSSPPAQGIFLTVNPGHPQLQGKSHEAFHLLTDSQGIHITGNSAVAVRHGAYALLEKLGYRWYFQHPMWHVKPSTLQSLALNEVQEPFFIERGMRAAIGELIGGADGVPNQKAWFRYNRVFGDSAYEARHSWPNFASRGDVAAEDPTAVCYKPDGVTPQQSLPDHSVVINRALNFARNYFASETSSPHLSDDTLTKLSVPISPPDGNTIWCDEWQVDVDQDGDLDYSAQVITDKTFALTNEVARILQQEFPGKYASVLSYSWYPEIPSFDLEDNVYVEVTTFTHGQNVPNLQERLTGYKQMGALTGVYDYYDVWPWWKDRIPPPGKYRSLLTSVQTAADTNADTFYFEASDNWAPKGRLYWVGSQLMWDPLQGTASVDAATTLLLDDFYTNAFGPAKAPMKRYYERFDTQPHTDSVMGLAFQDINEALTLAAGRPEIQERIWFVFYHTYFWWQWGDNVEGAAFTDVEEAKAMQTFLWKTSSLHLVTSRLQRERVVEPALKNFGLSSTDIAALKDTTLPSATERQAWLDEALANWEGEELLDLSLVDPLEFQPFTAAGNTSLPKLRAYQNTRGGAMDVVIPSAGSETVAVQLRSTGGYDWLGPDGTVLQTEEFNNLCGVLSSGCDYRALDREDAQFSLPATSSGLYTLRVHGNSIVDVPDRAASISNHTATQKEKFDTYFSVPAGTSAFLLGGKNDRAGGVQITLTDPSGTALEFSGPSGEANEWNVNNPAEGIWRLQASFPSNIGGRYWIHGIPVLVWPDPQYLLIPSIASSQDTTQAADETSLLEDTSSGVFSLTTLNRHYLFQDDDNTLEVEGSFDTSGTSYTLEFSQAGVVKKTISLSLADSTTLRATISSTNLSSLPPGLYDLAVEKTSDGETKTYSTQIAITRKGDLWSPNATDSSTRKRDGKIDIHDASRLLTKWNSTQAADLQEADINPGPNNVSQGKIDIFDANKLMANWRP